MRKTRKAIIGTLITCMLAYYAVPISAGKVIPKEEVVYIITDPNGKALNVNVVNIFRGGNIVDYGNYSHVKMLTTNDEIHRDKDKITFSSNAEKVYYQGTLENVEIPWNISISYFLNGRAYSPSEIVGKSGDLEIRFRVTENKKSTGTFYEDYALQASFTLNTNKDDDIEAKDATIANVGSNKQLTYTILPGKGIDTTIKAKVTNFEMQEVQINGVKLNLNVSIDDEELLDKVGQIMDATKKLNEGVDRVYKGSDKLLAGSDSLNTGITSLNSGITELDHGILKLQTGVNSMQDGLNVLNSKSSSLTDGSSQVKEALTTIQSSLSNVSLTSDSLGELTSSSNGIKAGIDKIYSGMQSLQQSISYSSFKKSMVKNGLNIDTLKSGNTDMIQSITSKITELTNTISRTNNMESTLASASDIEKEISDLQMTLQLLKGNNAVISGVELYLKELENGVDTLSDGVTNLKDNYSQFNGAIETMANSLGNLAVNMSNLRDGINQLVSKYSELDSGLNQYTEGVATIVASYKQIVDGVSSLAVGSNKLLDGSGVLSNGATELYKGVEKLCNGASDLASGSSEFYSETSHMDTEVEDEIDTILSSIKGDETKTHSFVSDKNKNISSVQFVIKTEAIELPEQTENNDGGTEKLSFWQKLIRLFKPDK